MRLSFRSNCRNFRIRMPSPWTRTSAVCISRVRIYEDSLLTARDWFVINASYGNIRNHNPDLFRV